MTKKLERSDNKVNLEPVEATAIAFCITYPHEMHKILDLQPHHFYNALRARVYKVLVDIYKNDGPGGIETVGLVDSCLAKAGIAEDQRISIITECNDYAPGSPGAIKSVMDVIIHESTKRLLGEASQNIKEIAESTLDTDEMCEFATDTVGSVIRQTHTIEVTTLTEQLGIEIERMSSDGQTMGFSTGLGRLDYITAGLHKGDLVVIGARTSLGKSSLLGHMAYSLAVDQNLPGVIFSMEMPASQYTQRLIACKSGNDIHRVRQKALNHTERQTYIECAKGMYDTPLYIMGQSGLNITKLVATVSRLYYEHNIQWVGIDYLQLMQHSRKPGESTADAVGNTSRALKAMANNMQLPVILLSQVNRDPDKRDNKRPQLSDLRASGRIEEDADVVLFIYRDSAYPKDLEDKERYKRLPLHDCEIDVAKQRNGPLGTAFVWFVPKCAGFVDKDEHEEQTSLEYTNGS